ncbi:Cell division control protein 25 [Pichia kudriavzevii]|nr:Cell division control protein 25 [Pichia kudriavzevii]
MGFKTHLNDASNKLSFYHIACRQIHPLLDSSNKVSKLSSILKKITDTFIQFRIWSNLAIVSIDAQISHRTGSKLGFEDNLMNGSTINDYIKNSTIARSKLEKLSIHLIKFMSTVPIMVHNGYTQKNTSKMLPMVYTRFIKDKFEGGNYKNKLTYSKYHHNDYFIDVNHDQPNILLDEAVTDKLKVLEINIFDSLKQINDILLTQPSKDMSLQQFNEKINISLLTAVYKCVPLLSQFINTFESIDLTVFAMIDRMAKKPSDYKRNTTLIKSEVEDPLSPSSTPLHHTSNIETLSSSTSDFGNSIDSGEDSEKSSQSFYDATAKVFRPLICEFLQLKQSLHSAFSDLILDSQTITADDPETFSTMRDDSSLYTKPSKFKMVADILLMKLQKADYELHRRNSYILDPKLKLMETINVSKDRIKLINILIIQLRDERRTILNYCSRLMNSDFNIASLFIAERHNTIVSKSSQATATFSGKYSSGSYMNEDDERENSVDEKLPDYGYTFTNANTNEEHVPWYMTMDHDEEKLIYEGSILKGGPVRGLVSKLVNPNNQPDELFEQTFLCFFSTFVKPAKLFEILIEKYNLSMPEALSYEEYGIWIEQKLKPQQQRILDIFIKLFSRYWIVNYTTSELINTWDYFVEETPSVKIELINLSAKVFSFDNQEEYIDYFKLGNMEPKTIPVAPLSNSILHLRLQSLNINYVAEQITAVQAFYYRKLNMWDLLGRTYNFARILRGDNEMKHSNVNMRDPLGTKNISNFIKCCNNLTHYTSFMILKNSDLNERMESIKFFILLAEKLMAMNNFSSMTAIISGLGSTSISRLRKTWDQLPQVYINKFQKMDNLMSIGKNYSEYRNILKFVNADDEAYMPFLGMYLSDLRFTTDGNSDWLTKRRGSKGLVNFAKRVSIMKIINEVLDFNNTLYNIRLDEEFSCYLQEMFKGLPDDEKMYQLSIEIEPRVSVLKNGKGLATVGLMEIADGTYQGSVTPERSSTLSSFFGTFNSIGSFSTPDGRNNNERHNSNDRNSTQAQMQGNEGHHSHSHRKHSHNHKHHYKQK